MVRIRIPLTALVYASALLGFAPLSPHMETAPLLLFLLFWGGGLTCDLRRRHPVGAPLATLLSLGFCLYYGLGLSRANLVLPLVHILTLLLGVRLLTAKSPRNVLQVFLLSLFALASSSLLSLEASFFAYLVPLVTGITVGLVLLCFYRADPDLALEKRQMRTVLATALLLPAGSLVLMLVFFVILPRTGYPLWDFLNPAAGARTGFSEQVTPGSVARIAEDRKVAFRAEGPEIPLQQRYWRGVVLNRSKGSDWIRTAPPEGEQHRVAGGSPVGLTILSEPQRTGFLYALDPPADLSGVRAARAADGVFRLRRSPEKRYRYRAESRPGGTLTAEGADREFYLQMPADKPQRLSDLARDIRSRGTTETERIALLEDFFRNQRLAYATDDLPVSADPLTEFLFEKKRGYCEFFASSFATLLRLSGVPARLVGGYYGGDYNELGGYYAVTEDRAHVWVEALVENRWVRLDPSTLAVNAASTLERRQRSGLGPAARLFDALQYLWNQAVLTYDLGRQLSLFRQTGRSLRQVSVSRETLGWIFGLAMILAAAGGAVGVAHRRRKDKEGKLARAFVRRVQKKYALEGIGPETGLLTVARRSGDPLCLEFAELYCRGAYGGVSLGPEERRRLREILRALG
ncbi:DUF3488 and transglutaminase-like domain-containing protein [uncultured Desulfuromonas sp.]|uniref:transglutaminase family protein n=1 Tax=uncultured Desulfuromonas sp. TaxID=181013 RepID=UPI00260B7027|nr:DUF3488 and transglutaminase-like domain-containing protein [uncultured Desulfuromonas sp.]